MAKIGINLSTGSFQKDEFVVGIDLGTTNSLIAIVHPDTKKATVLKEYNQHALVPSVVHFGDSISVGETALQYVSTDPLNTIFSVKRLIGKSYEDVQVDSEMLGYKIVDNASDTEKMVRVQVGDKYYTAIELSALILKELKDRAEHILKTSVHKAVITVPAYFNDSQRQATKDAAKLAGLDALRIINEPTAASLAYGIGIDKQESKTIAVFDLGGGTFDVSILRIEDGVFEVLSTSGDTHLGGDDFDKKIVDLFKQQITAQDASVEFDKTLLQVIRLSAQAAKKQLSSADQFEGKVLNFDVQISKIQFEEMCAGLVAQCIKCCSNALTDSGLSVAEIQEVLMVGGSTRMPMVKHAAARFFGREVNDSINPDEAVALGAAIQADVLSGGTTNDVLLLDVTPLSLGIETMGGLMETLVPRNSKIPTSVAKEFTTHKDGQVAMAITVYQGERDLVKDNRKLTEFELRGIPAMPAGLAKVQIAFKINTDGILTVQAKELRSGVQQTVDVRPQYGLTDEEVEAMLLSSLTNAKADVHIRALTEARTEAEVLISTTNAFLSKHKDLITSEEKLATEDAITELKTAQSNDDRDKIHALIDKLNAISTPYAQRVMDKAVATALTGQNLKDK
jgi:molecular chaperone HscA